MSIAKSSLTIKKLSSDILKQWSQIPTAIAGDCMNRQNVMASRISPIKEGTKLIGQARTVSITHGDNSAIHACLTIMNEGDVLVVEGGGFSDRAVWGGIMNRVAIIQKLGGVVIDGSVRDISELKEMKLPVYASSYTPSGPTKGGGGYIDVPISCGAVAVNPGDLIIGDDDGVSVIPIKRANTVLQEAHKRLNMENQIISRLENGDLHKDIFNIKEIPILDDLEY